MENENNPTQEPDMSQTAALPGRPEGEPSVAETAPIPTRPAEAPAPAEGAPAPDATIAMSAPASPAVPADAAQPAPAYVPAAPTEPIAVPAAPAKPTETVGGAFTALWAALVLFFKGKLVDAFNLGETYRHYWHVAVGVFLGLTGLVYFSVAVATVNGANDAFGRVFGSAFRAAGSPFSAGLQAFFIGAILAAIFVFARIAGMFFTLKVRGLNVPFGRVATVWAVAATPWIFMLVISAVVGILPSYTTFLLATIISMIGIPMTIFMAELSFYVGLNRIAPVEKSLLVPHTLFTGLALLVSGLATMALFEMAF